jgi:hypothetical protein
MPNERIRLSGRFTVKEGSGDRPFLPDTEGGAWWHATGLEIRTGAYRSVPPKPKRLKTLGRMRLAFPAVPLCFIRSHVVC